MRELRVQSLNHVCVLPAEGLFEFRLQLFPRPLAEHDAGKQQQPLIPPRQHAGNQRFAIRQAGVAQLQNVCQRIGELLLDGSTEMRQRALRCERVQRLRIFGGLSWPPSRESSGV